MKRNKFLPGFVSGFLVTFVFSLVLFITWYGNSESSNILALSNPTIGSDSAETDSTTASVDTSTILNKISVLESIINTYYMGDIDGQDLADGIYKGLLDSLNDPYSCYYTADEYKSLMESSAGKYCGIGATVSQDTSTGVITVIKPFVSGPAYEAGILPNDVLYQVNGQEVTGQDISEVVSMMKGVEGTDVTITVLRDGEDTPLEFIVKRKTIEVPTVEYKMLENNIGYVLVTEFDEVTASQYREAIEKLQEDGMEALVVDLRNNPGGRLTTVVDMLDRMLPEGLIVYQEDKYGNRQEEKSSSKEEFSQPLAVLINGNSASASEIFAGAIQDYGIGTLVGTTSFGKGIVQSIIPLKDETAVKVTVSKYYTPNGRNIHGVGIEPDVVVDLDEEAKRQVVIDYEDDTQLQKAVEILEGKMK